MTLMGKFKQNFLLNHEGHEEKRIYQRLRGLRFFVVRKNLIANCTNTISCIIF